MFHLSGGVTGDEYEASTPDVPRPNFITQGVSSRRDGAYIVIVLADDKSTSSSSYHLQLHC